MITLNGYFKGTFWNKDSKKFEIKKLGTAEAGAILCGLNVSGKTKEGDKTFGKPVDVKINIKSPAEGKRVYGLIASGESMCECDGFFVPANWTDKEGKEVKGNQFLVNDSTTFKKYDGVSAPKKESATVEDEESNPWS